MVTTEEKRFLWRWIGGATTITAVVVCLLVLMTALPTICPASYPAPASCAADARVAPAIWGSSVMLTLLVATVGIGLGIRPAHRDAAFGIGVVLLIVGGVVSLVLSLGASGFIVGI